MLARVSGNRAADLGPSKFPWWLDWRGECVAIIASGPSAKGSNIDELRNRIHVIAVKKSVELCPWADVVYGCDEAWWKYDAKGLPKFDGLKMCYAPRVCDAFKDIYRIDIKKNIDNILTDEPGVIGSGGNSGFQALNIAVQFGATGILMIGFDMHSNGGIHWYGNNKWLQSSNPIESNYRRWRRSFTDAAPLLAKRNIDVINAAPNSEVSCFRKATVEDALAGWGL